MTQELEKRPCTAHPDELTRLSCTECETPVCPKCMVMYEVGFKCRQCAKSRPSHIVTLSNRHRILAPVLGLLAGQAYGWVHPYLMALGFFRIFGIPILGLFLAYLLGKLAGNLIQRPLQYKRGPVILALLSISAMAGMMLSPFANDLLRLLIWLSASIGPNAGGTSPLFYLLPMMARLAAGLLFIKGLRKPFA